MDDPVLPLAEGFTAYDAQSWLAVVERDLGGADFARRLHTRLPEGLTVGPLYTAAEAPATAGPLPAATRPAGRVVQELFLTAATTGRELVAEAADSGAEAVLLTGDTPDTSTAWRELLADAPHGLAIGLMAEVSDAAAAALVEEAGDRILHLGRDPLARLLTCGDPPETVAAAGAAVWRAAAGLGEASPASTAIGVSSLPVHAAGADAATELGTLLAAGVWHLRRAEEVGLDPAAAAGLLHLRCAVTADQFLEIAKLRALRRCWQRVLAACGVIDAPAVNVHAFGSRRVLTRRDPWVNLLRATVMGVAGIAGGCDWLVLPAFDVRSDGPGRLGRRLARNTTLILRQEGLLDVVADPAAGSFYIERLGADLADTAWEAFQTIEAAGGLPAALADGSLAERIDTVVAARDRDVARRKRPITGLSEYPLVDEEPPPSAAGASSTAGLPAVFAPRSEADGWESLRDRADAWTAQQSARARVFLAGLGDPATYDARATWTRNALAAGGFQVVAGPDGAELPALVAAYRQYDAGPAVICGPDDLYAERIPELAAGLVAAGCPYLLVAGRPGGYEEVWRAAGVSGFAYLGADLLTLLGEVWQALEAER